MLPSRKEGALLSHRNGMPLWTEDTATWALGPAVGRRLACLGVDFPKQQRQIQANHPVRMFFDKPAASRPNADTTQAEVEVGEPW